MSDRLQQLLREEGDRVDVPPPPTGAILTDGRRRLKARRARGLVAVAASVAVVAGGLVGALWLGSDDSSDSTPDPAGTASATSSPSATAAGGPLDVSGSSVGAHPFGTDADEVLAAVGARFGEPDLSTGPQRYARIPGTEGWFEDGDDALSPSWRHPVVSVSCWDVLCLVFGGDRADALQLRGWELAQYRRWSGEELTDLHQPDVRLAGTGIRLGDGWERVHAAYPDTLVAGGEGATVTIRNTPWPGVSDGVADWRLSGQWDYTRPNRAPADAVVIRLSGGEGPQPGCC